MVFGTNGFGYRASSSSFLRDAFGDAHDNTPQTSNLSLMARVTGVNFTAGLPQAAALPVNTATSFSGLENQKQAAQGAEAQIAEAGAKFESAVASVQNVVYAALEQSVDQMNAENPMGRPISTGAAAASIAPQPMSGSFDVASAVFGDSIMGGATSRVVQAIGELGPEFTRLSPEQQSKLLSHMHSLMTDPQNPQNPNRSVEGDLTYDFSGIKPEELKQLLMPAELHPEGQTIKTAQHAIEHDVIDPLAGHDVVASVSEGDTAKNLTALASSGVNIEQVLPSDLLEDVAVAVTPLAEADAPAIAEAEEPVDIDVTEIELLASALPETTVETSELVPESPEMTTLRRALEPAPTAAPGTDWVRKIDVANAY